MNMNLNTGQQSGNTKFLEEKKQMMCILLRQIRVWLTGWAASGVISWSQRPRIHEGNSSQSPAPRNQSVCAAFNSSSKNSSSFLIRWSRSNVRLRRTHERWPPFSSQPLCSLFRCGPLSLQPTLLQGMFLFLSVINVKPNYLLSHLSQFLFRTERIYRRISTRVPTYPKAQ